MTNGGTGGKGPLLHTLNTIVNSSAVITRRGDANYKCGKEQTAIVAIEKESAKQVES